MMGRSGWIARRGRVGMYFVRWAHWARWVRWARWIDRLVIAGRGWALGDLLVAGELP